MASGQPGNIANDGPMPAHAAGGRHRLYATLAVLLLTLLALATLAPRILAPDPRPRPLLPGLTLENSATGLIITSVQGNSIADNAGFRTGDHIVALDERKIFSRADVARYIARRHPKVIDMTLVRGAQSFDLLYAFPGNTQP